MAMETTWTPPAPTLFTLPQELKDMILSGLDYHDLVPLRQSCHAATELVPCTMIKAVRKKLKDDLLAEEQADYDRRQLRFNNFANWARAFPQERRLESLYEATNNCNTISNIHANFITKATKLTCYGCLRNLPRECFTDAQAMGSRSFGHKQAEQRFCKACGVQKGIWEKGTLIKDTKRTLVVCRGCISIQKADSKFNQAGVCSAQCLERAEAARPAKEKQVPEQPGGDRPHRLPSPSSTASAELLDNDSTSTRADRCMRCWMRNHTSTTADGELGLHLCKSCETRLDHAGGNFIAQKPVDV